MPGMILWNQECLTATVAGEVSVGVAPSGGPCSSPTSSSNAFTNGRCESMCSSGKREVIVRSNRSPREL